MEERKPLFYFCHGWMLDKGFSEVTCKRRETCAYYSVDFYRHHGHHLDEFDEMFPMAPCQFYIPKQGSEPRKAEENAFDFFLQHV